MTASILVLRVYIRIRKQHRLYADDYFLFFSVVAYWILAVLYIVDLPHAYAFFDFLAGKKAIPLPELQKQYHDLLMISFAVTALFWGVLWCVPHVYEPLTSETFADPQTRWIEGA